MQHTGNKAREIQDIQTVFFNCQNIQTFKAVLVKKSKIEFVQ